MTSPHAPAPPLVDRPPADLWRRALARLLDALTVFFMLWALAVMQILWPVNRLAREVTPEPWGAAFVPTLLFAVSLFAHEAFFVAANRGQTPGMDACGVRVVAVDGGSLTTRQCIARAAPVAVLWLVPPLWLGVLLAAVTVVPALVSPTRLSTQDRLARTRVVPYDRSREDPESAKVRGPVMRRNFRGALDRDRARHRPTNMKETPT